MTRRGTDDAALVAALRAGDEAAFDALHARYRPQLVRYARKVLQRSAPGMAEDVVQEALWRAHRALLRDDRPMQLRPWLYRLVRNCCLDELARVRVPAVDVADAGLAADPRDEPHTAVERRADLRRVLDDLAGLPTSQRHALVRRELDGVPHAGIAAELQISPQAARSLVHRARLGLTRAAAARGAECAEVRSELLAAHDERRRATAGALRHVAACSSCRDLRAGLRAQRRTLQVLAPPAVLVTALAGLKLTAAGKAGGAKAAAATGVAVAGAGLGVQVFAAGAPSPVTAHSLALPGGALARAAPVPEGVAIVQHAVRPRPQEVGVTCPPGLRVADLLRPRGGRVDVSYDRGTRIGRQRRAVVRVQPHAPGGTGRVVVGVLCRRPDRAGSIVDPAVREQRRRDVAAARGARP